MYNAFAQEWDGKKRQLKNRATVFGTILQSYKVSSRQKPVFNHIAHGAGPASPVRLSSGKRSQQQERARRTSASLEFHEPHTQNLVDSLKAKYNAEHAVDEHLHTPAALMRRESLQWDQRVLDALNIIWYSSDTDSSGGIDQKEYQNMHSKMYKATHGHLDGWTVDMANQDWEGDRDG
jgi:hypothetical protein